jgi:DNA-binding MarR family transcriptional regulator
MQIYTDHFDLGRPEWRVIAALAELGPVAAKDVSSHCNLDKTTVSRAVAALEAKGLPDLHDDPQDRRKPYAAHNGERSRVYHRILPLALAQEEPSTAF